MRGRRTFGVLTALLAALAAPGAPPASAQEVAITEVLASGGAVVDEDGDTPNWIEIQNQGADEAQLDGWYLTDDRHQLARWRFPARALGPGDFLLVFASGKDRAPASGNLHASFKLSAGGEFLALVRPDGKTIASSLTFPEQFEGISYGPVEVVQGAVLLAAGAAARYLVPSGPSPTDWTLPEFPDSAWPAGHTGIGFDLGGSGIPQDPTNIASEGTAVQSSDYAGGSFPASLAIDGDFDNFTHTAAGQNLPAFWELDFPTGRSIQSIVLHNRPDCCRSRLRDITVEILDGPGGATVFASDLLNPQNELGGGGLSGPESLTVDLLAAGGPVRGRSIRVSRTPDPTLSGTGGQGNADEADVLSMSEVEVFEADPGFSPWIATDVGPALRGVNPSLYLRAPFQVANPGAFQLLDLRMKYDDGFVAFLNGREVARRNAPAALQWNSTATAEHPDPEASADEVINLSLDRDALRPGSNVLAIQALNLTAADDDLLVLPVLEGSTIAPGPAAYFLQPTPGAPNPSQGTAGFVARARITPDHGFFDQPFPAEISSATEGAEIRFTLDGSAPDEENGLLYDGPIPIEGTTVLRARAFKAGLEPTGIDTHTFIFVDDVVQETAATTRAAGFPATWAGAAPDYGMDRTIVGPGDSYGGAYASTISDDLKSIPSLSIVMAVDDLFGVQGIYSHPTSGGDAWERPASAELVLPDGGDGFQVDCGIRVQGGYFRSPGATPKHSFRLLFRKAYGPEKLEYPIFGPRERGGFDTLTLRAGANDGYSWDAARLTEQYVRDEFGRDILRAAGSGGAPGGFVHLYLNGVYWGLYNPVERPDHAYSARNFGGPKEAWDSIHDGVPTNGDLAMWNAMIAQATATGSSLSQFMKLQGKNPDGSRNPQFRALLDVPEYADYLIVNLWGGNWDWPWKNWWAARSRSADSTGFKFYIWDFENTMGNNLDRSPLSKNALLNDFSGAGQPHALLKNNPEYRLAFADRVHRLYFNHGPLTPESTGPRYSALAGKVERAIVGESARWGDQHFRPPLTLKEWRTERDWILGAYLPQRTGIVLGQLRAAGLYPSVEAPAFNQNGGLVPAGFAASATAPKGAIYWTADGTDPRLPGGAASPAASVAPAGTSLQFTVDATAVLKARALDGTNWSALDEAVFIIDVPLRITEIMYHPAADPAGRFEADDFEFVEIQNVGGGRLDLRGLAIDGGIAFDFAENGLDFLEAGQLMVLVANGPAFAARYDTTDILLGGEYTGHLSNGGDFLVLRDAAGQAILDLEFRDDWYPGTDGGGRSLVAVDPRGAPPDFSTAGGWRPSAFPLGSPGFSEDGLAAGGAQMPGDLNQDRALDISDVISFLFYLFGDPGRALPCSEGGAAGQAANRALLDANGDGAADLSDAVHLLGFLFLSGPPHFLGQDCAPIPGCPDVCR